MYIYIFSLSLSIYIYIYINIYYSYAIGWMPPMLDAETKQRAPPTVCVSTRKNRPSGISGDVAAQRAHNRSAAV